MKHHLLLASFCLILASTLTGVLGFTATARRRPSSRSSPSTSCPSVQARTATTLQSSSAAANDYYNPNYHSPSLLELASQCATSDSCSVDMANSYLREIFHAQSGCIAMTGNPNVDSAMCVDVDVVAEVVANLRNKISSSSSPSTNNIAAAHRRAENDVPLPPLSAVVMTAAAIVVAAEIMTLLIHSNSNMAAGAASPITIREMYWAIRDGYVGDVMTHVFRNGGLLVTDDANNIVMDTTSSILSTTATSSLTPQELYWSVRDGYVSDTLLASSRGIGDSGSGIVPFTPQEIYWAIRNGYVNNLTLHLLRNGGLLV